MLPGLGHGVLLLSFANSEYWRPNVTGQFHQSGLAPT
jgi:hypothetical protein